MKLLFILFGLIVSSRAQADLGFTYSETPDYAKPKLIDILEVQTELEERGYWPVDLSHEQKLQGLGVDQLFFDATTTKLVILKIGQKVSDSKIVNQLISFEGDFLYHGVTSGEVPFALYFINHRESEARVALQEFGIKSKVSLLRYLLPEAQANCGSAMLRAMTSVAGSLSVPPVLQRLWNCGMAVGTGARDTVKGFVKGVGTFVSDPAKFWRQTKESARQLWGFVKNIHVEVINLMKIVGGLDFETGMQIGCTIAGKLLPGILAGIVTGGAASALIARSLPLLTYQLNKVRSMSSVLRVLSQQRRAGRLRNADEAIERVVSCAR